MFYIKELIALIIVLIVVGLAIVLFVIYIPCYFIYFCGLSLKRIIKK